MTDVEPTGHPQVDAVLSDLAAVPELPLADHLPRLTAAHQALHAVLTVVDGDPGGDSDRAAPELADGARSPRS